MEWKLNLDADPQGSSNDFWYDLTKGGYIKAKDVLTDEEQIKAVNDAISLLASFESALEDAELLNEF